MAESTCAVKLAEANIALHALMTGKQMVEVGYGERRVKYYQATIADLRAYISQLEAECGENASVLTRRRPFGMAF